MLFHRMIGLMETEAITPSGAVPAVTKRTAAGKARFAVEIQASGGDVYVGNKEVTSSNGLCIKDGESRVFPVNRNEAIYITGGPCVVVDYYDG